MGEELKRNGIDKQNKKGGFAKIQIEKLRKNWGTMRNFLVEKKFNFNILCRLIICYIKNEHRVKN